MADPTDISTQESIHAPETECASSSSVDSLQQEDTSVTPKDNAPLLYFSEIEPVYGKIIYIYKFCIQAKRLEQLAYIADSTFRNELRRIYGCCYIIVSAAKTQNDQFSLLKQGLDILNITEEDIKKASQLILLPRDNLIEVINELYTQTTKHSEEDTRNALVKAQTELKTARDDKALIKCLNLQLEYAYILREQSKDTTASCAELNALTLKSLRLLSPGKTIDESTSALIQQAVEFDVMQYSAMLSVEQACFYLSQLTRLFVLENLDHQLIKQILTAFIDQKRPLINASEYYEIASRFLHSAKEFPGWSANDIEVLLLIEDKLNMRKESVSLLVNLELLGKQLNPVPKNLNLALLNETVSLFIKHTKLMPSFNPDEKVVRQFSGMLKKAVAFIKPGLLAVLDEQIKNTIRILDLLDEKQKESLNVLYEQTSTFSALISALRTPQEKPSQAETSSPSAREQIVARRKTKRGSPHLAVQPKPALPESTHASTSSSAASSQKHEMQLTLGCPNYLVFSAEQEWMDSELNSIIMDIYAFCISTERLRRLPFIADPAKRTMLQDIYLNCYKIVALGGHNHAVYPLFKDALAALQIEDAAVIQVDEFATMPLEHLIPQIHKTHGLLLDYQKADAITKIVDAGRRGTQKFIKELSACSVPSVSFEALEASIIEKIADATAKFNETPNDETIIARLEAQLDYSRLLSVQSKETPEGFAALDELVFASLGLLPRMKMDKRTANTIQTAFEFNIERYCFYLPQKGTMALIANKNLHAYLWQLNQLFSLKNPNKKLIMKLLGIFIILLSPPENELHYINTLNEFYSRAIKLSGWKKQDLEQLHIYEKMLRFRTISVQLKHHLSSLTNQPDLQTPNHDVHLLNDTIKLFINYLGLIHFESPSEIIMQQFIEAIDKSSALIEAAPLLALGNALQKAVSLLEKMQRKELSTQRETTLVIIKSLSTQIAELRQSRADTALQEASTRSPKPKTNTHPKGKHSRQSAPLKQGNKRSVRRNSPAPAPTNNDNVLSATQALDDHDVREQSVVSLNSEINTASPTSTEMSDTPEQPTTLLESETNSIESTLSSAEMSDTPEQPTALLESETNATESIPSSTEISDTPEQPKTLLESEANTTESIPSSTEISDAPEQPTDLLESEANAIEIVSLSSNIPDTPEPLVTLLESAASVTKTNAAESTSSSLDQADTVESSMVLQEQQHEEKLSSSPIQESSNRSLAKNSLAMIRNGFFPTTPTQLFAHELTKKSKALNALCTQLFALREQRQFLIHSFNSMKTGLSLMTQQPIVPALIKITSQNLDSLGESISSLFAKEKEILTSYVHQYGECSHWIRENTMNLLDLPPMRYGSEFLIDANKISLYNRAFVLGQYLNTPQPEVRKEELSLLFKIENDNTLFPRDPSLLFFVLRMQAHHGIKPAKPLNDFLKNEGRDFLLYQMNYNAHTIPAIMDAVWAGFAEGNALAFYQQLRAFNFFDILFPNAAECLKNKLAPVFERALQRTNNLPPEERDRTYIFNQLFLATPTYLNEESERSMPQFAP